MTMKGGNAPGVGAPRLSPFVLGFFRRYVRRHLRRHFHAVHLLGNPPELPGGRPTIIFMNHPSWWDPLLGIFLAHCFWPDRPAFAPMDAHQLLRFPILGKVGLFGICPSSVSGARTLLRTCDAVFADPRAMLWLTPQGRFADVRERPVRFQPGLAALARRFPQAAFQPLAVEYALRGERLPEILVHFGEPVDDLSPSGLIRSMEVTQDALAAAVIGKSGAIRPLILGRSGTGGIYDFIRRTARGGE